MQTGTNDKGKIGAFFQKYYALFFAPLIVFVAYLVMLCLYDVQPFGESYTVASYDLSAQIVPFIEHLFDVLDGKSSLTYSYAIAGGADVVGTFLYFFISPFSVLFLLFGDGNVVLACGFVVGLKLAAIAVAGTWFAKKLFRAIPDYLCVAIGVTYAYCGYTFVANTYINWLDFLIYLPFAAGAFVRFVRTGNFIPFSAWIACCIYTCFSIACFSMFIVFPTLVAFACLCVERKERNLFLTRLCLAFVVAVLAALPILLPSLKAYLVSGRNDGGLFENIWFGFKLSNSGAPLEFVSSSFTDKYGESLFRKWTYILSDSAFFVLSIVWFCRRGLKDGFAKFMLVAGVTTLLPTIVDEAMLLMNMGSYMSYALRFGFLNALYFLGGACLSLDGICFRRGCAYDGKPLYKAFNLSDDKAAQISKKDGGMYEENQTAPLKDMAKGSAKSLRRAKKGVWVWTAIFLAFSAAVLGFFIWYINGGNYKKIWEGAIKDDSLRETLKSFSWRFARSLGGLEVIALVFGIIAIVFAIAVVLVWKKRLGTQLTSFALLAIVGTQLLLYNNQLVLGNCSTQHIDIAAATRICERLKEDDASYFRVKDYSDRMTAPASFITGGDSFGVFSSVIDSDNFVVYNLFGYAGNGTNNLKSAHDKNVSNRCEVFGDAFLGYKYVLVTEEDKSEFEGDFERKSYMKPVMIASETGEQSHLRDGVFYVYENTLAFPFGYRVNGGAFKFARENTKNVTSRKLNQAALYTYLRGMSLTQTFPITGSSYTDRVTVESARELSEYLWSKAAEIEVSAGRICARVTNATSGECLFLNFVASTGYSVTVNDKAATLIDNDLNFLCVQLEEGDNVVEFVYTSPYGGYAAYGFLGALAGLCAVAFVLKKTRAVEYVSPVIAGAGIALAVAVVAIFMLYPTAVWVVKMVKWAL